MLLIYGPLSREGKYVHKNFLCSYYLSSHHVPEHSVRALSDVQESAQLLCGAGFAEAVLAGCFSNVPRRMMYRTVNLSTYDAHWEKAVMKFHLTEQRPRICSLSLTDDLDISQYCEQVLAVDLLQACCCSLRVFVVAVRVR